MYGGHVGINLNRPFSARPKTVNFTDYSVDLKF